MSKTAEALEAAFSEEAMDYFRFTARAEQADQEGRPGVAALFRAVARSAMVHALAVHALQREGGDTAADLASGIEEMTDKVKRFYPSMVKDAASEKEMDARHTLEYAMSAKMELTPWLKKAEKSPEDFPSAEYHVCPLCGYVAQGSAPKKCPYCGKDQSTFFKVQ